MGLTGFGGISASALASGLSGHPVEGAGQTQGEPMPYAAIILVSASEVEQETTSENRSNEDSTTRV